MQHGAGSKKGHHAEVRARQILTGLSKVVPIVEVTPASLYFDRKGIDLLVSVAVEEYRTVIPIQVKSSLRGARKYRHKYSTYIAVYGVVVIVVNKYRTEEEIREELIEVFTRIIASRITFEHFFEFIREKAREKSRKRAQVERDQLLETPLLGLRKKQRFFRPVAAVW